MRARSVTVPVLAVITRAASLSAGPVELSGREEQRARFVEHPWAESIARYLTAGQGITLDAVTTSTLVTNAAACPNARSTHADAIIAGNVLKGLGWAKVRHYQGKRGSTVYTRPESA